MREFTLVFTLNEDGSITMGGTYFDEKDQLDDSFAQVMAIGMLEIAKASLVNQRWKLIDQRKEREERDEG